ncbi:hypothetical protein [Rhodoferax sp. UBA5149]|uniref:hypothetical protein n=1 Tax=Rhodoferax sp. UBA5149 TaxID=1947379 RepID=UPI0025EC15A3|nr:hypothetical protein [Rhodoferax sp. UBA5149]
MKKIPSSWRGESVPVDLTSWPLCSAGLPILGNPENHLQFEPSGLIQWSSPPTFNNSKRLHNFHQH